MLFSKESNIALVKIYFMVIEIMLALSLKYKLEVKSKFDEITDYHSFKTDNYVKI